jgi:hypothetical protein
MLLVGLGAEAKLFTRDHTIEAIEVLLDTPIHN